MSKTVLKDPLFQLIGIGLLLYGLFYYFNPVDGSSAELARDIAAKLEQYASESPQPLTLEERKEFVRKQINEELLYQEAMRAGLNHDGFIRERLIQKARFYLEGQFVPPEADEQTLQAFWASNQNNYMQERNVSFEQRLLNAEGVSQIRDILEREPSESLLLEQIRPLLKPSMLSTVFEHASLAGVQALFGDEFIESLMEMPLNRWIGFVESEQGFHLVKVLAREDDRVSDYGQVKEKVKQDWIAAQREQWLQQVLESRRQQQGLSLEEYEEYIAHE